MYEKIFLTFDCEDFINDRSTYALYRILKSLQKYNLKALFFLTGHMAEKLKSFPEILNLLEGHEIGYHSSAHSVRPTIFEYTDVQDYKDAFLISLKRETAHINPLTGEAEGRGGIEFLKDLFPRKNIVSFRAPGGCWSPPHLEALKNLGMRFDFSASLSTTLVEYKGMTFYPFPYIDFPKYMLRAISPFELTPKVFLYSLFRNETIVLALHPNSFVNQNYWDSIYWKGNPKRLYKVQSKSWKDIKTMLIRFELLLKRLHFYQNFGLLEISSNLRKSEKKLSVTKKCVEKSFQRSISWTSFFNYKPKFLRSHFLNYFDIK